MPTTKTVRRRLAGHVDRVFLQAPERDRGF